MALITCHFFSESLGLSTSMTVILPQETTGQIGLRNVGSRKKVPTLYLLHGLSDDDTIWLRRTSIERYVAELGLAVVMPNVHRSFYTDMKYGNQYWTFLTEELPAVARSFFPLSEEREDNFVAGLSMGGYGAFKWALRHPDRFAAAGSLSGAVDLVNHIESGKSPIAGIDQLFEQIFGAESIRGTDNDLLHVMQQQSGSSAERPLLYQCCGMEDFLYEDNLSFREACLEAGYELIYEEGPGGHDWVYWDEYIQRFLKLLPLK
ncbi:alpha/beta hydrolase [Paenibacillus sp. YIM B09110]|uniref:alpha/beta hydrolase n=1 Tax=Paenibacillus sp. YIM B09110 TaxID=3126102 RepID=UPI00301C6ECA